MDIVFIQFNGENLTEIGRRLPIIAGNKLDL